MNLFKGSGVALVTPFKDGRVDFIGLERLIEWHIENSTDAIIICGTTGEASTLTDEEHRELIAFAVARANSRIPVIAGTGSNDTRYAIELSKYAEEVGVHGLLVVSPYYNKTTPRGLLEHFTAIASAVKIPIILYNVPGRTGVNIPPRVVAELAQYSNIMGIKEASGDISQVAEIARLCPDDFYIYSGNDDMIVPLLSLGGVGVISVVANILPKDTHRLVMSYLEGSIEEARRLQLKMNSLVHALFIETNPIPIKTAMNLLGMEVGDLRLPLVDMEDENKEILINKMLEYGLTPGGR